MSRRMLLALLVAMICFANVAFAQDYTYLSHDKDSVDPFTSTNPLLWYYSGRLYTGLLSEDNDGFTETTEIGDVLVTKSRVVASGNVLDQNTSVLVQHIFPDNYTQQDGVYRIGGVYYFKLSGDIAGLTAADFLYVAEDFGGSIIGYDAANQVLKVASSKMSFWGLNVSHDMFSLQYVGPSARNITIDQMVSFKNESPDNIAALTAPGVETDRHQLYIVAWSAHGWNKRVKDEIVAPPATEFYGKGLAFYQDCGTVNWYVSYARKANAASSGTIDAYLATVIDASTFGALSEDIVNNAFFVQNGWNLYSAYTADPLDDYHDDIEIVTLGDQKVITVHVYKTLTGKDASASESFVAYLNLPGATADIFAMGDIWATQTRPASSSLNFNDIPQNIEVKSGPYGQTPNSGIGHDKLAGKYHGEQNLLTYFEFDLDTRFALAYNSKDSEPGFVGPGYKAPFEVYAYVLDSSDTCSGVGTVASENIILIHDEFEGILKCYEYNGVDRYVGKGPALNEYITKSGDVLSLFAFGEATIKFKLDIDYNPGTNGYYAYPMSFEEIDNHDTTLNYVNDSIDTFRRDGNTAGSGFDYAFSGGLLHTVTVVATGDYIELFYNADGMLSKVELNKDGFTKILVQYNYTESTREILAADGTVIQREEYDDAGRIIRIQGEGDVVLYAADYNEVDGNKLESNLTRAEVALDVTNKYNPFSGVMEVIDNNGAAWKSTTTFDPKIVRPLKSTGYRGNGSETKYNPANGLVEQTFTLSKLGGDPKINGTSYTYTTRGDVKTSTSPTGAVTTYYYDYEEAGLGDLNGDGVTTQDWGNLIRTDSPGFTDADGTSIAGVSTFSVYDANNKLDYTTDALGKVTKYIYYTPADSALTGYYLGKLFKVIEHYGSGPSFGNYTTTYGYDSNGYTVWVEDARGYKSYTEVDVFGITTATVDKYGTRTEYLRDVRDRVLLTRVENKDENNNYLTPAWIYTKNLYDTKGRNYESRKYKSGASFTLAFGQQTDDTGCEYIVTFRNYYRPDARVDYTMDSSGNYTKYEYDSLGRQHITKGGYNPSTGTYLTISETVYNSYNEGSRSKDALNRFSVEPVIDNYGRTEKTTDMFSGVYNVTHYDALGRAYMTETFDRNNVKIGGSYSYFDELGRVWKSGVYDSDNVDAVEDYFWSYTYYDQFGRVWKSKDHAGLVTGQTEWYDNTSPYFGWTKKQTDSNGNYTEYLAYNNNGQSLTTQFVEQLFGGGTKTTSTVTSYNASGSVLTSTDILGRVNENIYDKLGRVVKSINYGNVVTVSVFDFMGRSVKQTRDDGGLNIDREFIYDDNFASHTTSPGVWKDKDDNGNETTYFYDAAGRKWKTAFANGTEMSNTFDVVGRVDTTTDQNGTVVTFNYTDADNTLESKTIALAAGVEGVTSEHFQYDDRLRRNRAENKIGAVTQHVTSWTYNNRGHVLTETQDGHTVTSTYDNWFGARDSVSYPGGRSITKTFDTQYRTDTINEGATTIADYEYTGASRLYDRAFANGTITDAIYDTVNRVDIWGHGATIGDFSYVYDAVNNKKYERRSWTGYDKGDFYTYDKVSRLTNVKYGVAGNDLQSFKDSGIIPTVYASYEGFDLDGVGNRNSVDDNGAPVSYTFNNMNEYTDVAGTPRSHDNNGNLVNNGLMKMYYDYQNRLVRVTDMSNNDVVRYSYDCNGRRMARLEPGSGFGALGTQTQGVINQDRETASASTRTQGGNSRRAKINALQKQLQGIENAILNVSKDTPVATGKNKLQVAESAQGSDNALEVLYAKHGEIMASLAATLNVTGDCFWYYDGSQIVEQRDDTDAIDMSFTYGTRWIDDVIELDVSGLKYYYHKNHLGSVYALTDNTGAVVERYEYTAYGEVTIYDPSLSIERTSSIAGNFNTYTSRQFDFETGLYFYRARYYDSSTGRFISHDPLGYIDGLNLYEYAGSNSIMAFDPWGTNYDIPVGPGLINDGINPLELTILVEWKQNVNIITGGDVNKNEIHNLLKTEFQKEVTGNITIKIEEVEGADWLGKWKKNKNKAAEELLYEYRIKSRDEENHPGIQKQLNDAVKEFNNDPSPMNRQFLADVRKTVKIANANYTKAINKLPYEPNWAGLDKGTIGILFDKKIEDDQHGYHPDKEMFGVVDIENLYGANYFPANLNANAYNDPSYNAFRNTYNRKQFFMNFVTTTAKHEVGHIFNLIHHNFVDRPMLEVTNWTIGAGGAFERSSAIGRYTPANATKFRDGVASWAVKP